MSLYDKNYRDDDRRADIDALFAELCLDSVGVRPAPIPDEAEAETETLGSEPETFDAEPTDDRDVWSSSERKREAVQIASQPKKKKKHRIRRFFLGLIPKKGDSVLEIIRKCVCILALLVFVGSACVLLDDFVITPIRNTLVSNASRQRLIEPLTPEEANYGGYPAGILEKFKKSYYHNHDLVGWITYPSTSQWWHGIDYAVVQRPGDNDYYLKRDFDQNENKNGSIYMDYRCDYATPDSDCRVTLIYGHNMRDGQMFASLNQLLDLSMARCSPTFTFSSLFEENQYKVFAVFNVDTREAGAYDFLNQTIATDEDFIRYIAEMRVRSWFNYNDVDVNVSDEIVLLYTCSNTYQTTMGDNGRTLVAARRVRPGESPEVNTATITENSSRVMPKVWYANKGLPLPAYYQSGVSSDYLDAVGRTAPTTAATTTTTKPATTTTKATTTTTAVAAAAEPAEEEPAYEWPDDDEPAAPTAPTTPAPIEPEPTEPAPTEPTEPDVSAAPAPVESAVPAEPDSAEPAPIEEEPAAPEEPVEDTPADEPTDSGE